MATYPYRHTKSNHDMKCKKCGKEFKVFAWGKDVGNVKCVCGGNTDEIVAARPKWTIALHVWTPYLEENIKHQPVMVNSKKHLKQLCKDNDCVAHRLD